MREMTLFRDAFSFPTRFDFLVFRMAAEVGATAYKAIGVPDQVRKRFIYVWLLVSG